VGITPSGHAGELDSIFDDVVNLAVGEGLSLGGPKIGDSRIQIQAHLSLPAAVYSMTIRTLTQKVFSALVCGIGSLLEWILLASLGFRDG